jgi:hypothetical protein
MPKNTNYIVALILIVLFVSVGSLYFGKKHAQEAQTALNNTVGSSTDTTTEENGATTTTPNGIKKPITLTTGNIPGFYSYANATYNFSIQYPPKVQPLTSFATFHEIGNNWRLNAGQANQGKAVVSFSLYNIDQGTYSTGKQTYPLYFTSEVRVGVSPNVQNCYATDAGYTNQVVTNVTINGAPFKRFSSSDAGMQKYVQSESYRTIHRNMCYVIEQIRAGSSYRDEKMAIGTTDAELMSYYNLGEKIVKTFKFTK